MNDQANHLVSAEEKLDSKLLLLGVWRRRYLLMLWVLVSIGVGIAAGLLLGKKTYTAKASLYYDQAMFKKVWDQNPPSPQSFVGLVKMPQNLEKTRARLEMPVAVLDLEKNTKAGMERDTGLIEIGAEWESAEGAYEIARTLTQVFLENTRETMKAQVDKELRLMRERLASAEKRMNAVDDSLRVFLARNGVSPSDFSMAQSAAMLSDLGLSYSNAQTQRRALQAELSLVESSMALAAGRAARERELARQEMRSNVAQARSQTLRTQIDHERTKNVQQAELIHAQLQLDRARKLREKGLISQVEYEQTFTAYQRQRAMTAKEDVEREWEALTSIAQPSLTEPVLVPSESEMTALRDRAERLRIELSALDQKAQVVASSLGKIKAQQARMPALQREYTRLVRDYELREKERNEVAAELSRMERVSEAGSGLLAGLQLVREPEVPMIPTKSRGRLIMLIVAMGSIFVGFGMVIGRELLDNRIKSPSELPVKLAMPVIGSVTRPAMGRMALPSGDLAPDFAPIARRIREQLPQAGARLMVVSARHGEGKSLVATNLARALAARNEDVLLVDAEVTSPNENLRNIIPVEDEALRGLGDYLRGETDRMDDVVFETRYPRVSCVPFLGKEASCDLIETPRMRELLKEAADRYSVVLVEASPLVEEGRAEAMARNVDAILFVVQNWKYDIPTLRRAIEQIQPSGVPILGAVVTGVDPLYLEKN